MVLRIVSGGQTGVDRAALDFALSKALPHGGWCPKGRRSEDGRIADCYRLVETPGRGYRQRTEWNVRDSDGTLVITGNPKRSGGTRYTLKIARKLGKPCIVVDPEDTGAPAEADRWLESNGIESLNVAGPRESTEPAIHERAMAFLEKLYRLR
ncbi:molybdenum cofactor carrier [Prosthecochloris sp. GSB1]|uniref:putative molybdenum carrier protein n=1 Tax=Prosthecochloris sp. GSB1 TaxID=281093 RepID=UPI000B8CD070|nr:putative molybdenum carrier protein [Prosthecochloris sp. GSB1]ASQ90996.1 molybdenum cofactor carrier [Prosthecochloris sp. GSB1]